jgi:hypothetical protein
MRILIAFLLALGLLGGSTIVWTMLDIPSISAIAHADIRQVKL